MQLLAKLVCLIISAGAGWYVYFNIHDLFNPWVSIASSIGVTAILFCLFYFPLAKPISGIINDRLSVATHRGRHIRAGSGLDSIPVAPMVVSCTICGKNKGPVCPACREEMSRKSNYSIE